MTRWQFTGYDQDDLAGEYIDAATGEAYYHRYWGLRMEPTLKASEPKLLETMAHQYGLAAKAFENTLRSTVFPKGSNEQLAAFLLVARKYNLNPFTKEIYAIPREDGIAIIVPIDGWLRIINDHPQFDGMELDEHFGEDGAVVAVTCKIYRKDRSHPMVKTEYLAECNQNTLPWRKWPARMLGHKATIQCARYAFSLSGIIDPDEAARYIPEEAIAANAEPAESEAAPAIPKYKQAAARYKQAEEKRLADPKAQAAEDQLREQLKASVELEEAKKAEALATLPASDEISVPAAYERGRQDWHKKVARHDHPRWPDGKLIDAWASGWDREEHDGDDLG